MNGTGNANAATAPSILMARAIPTVLNIGRAAMGSPAAIMLRKNVFADTAEAAYT